MSTRFAAHGLNEKRKNPINVAAVFIPNKLASIDGDRLIVALIERKVRLLCDISLGPERNVLFVTALTSRFAGKECF